MKKCSKCKEFKESGKFYVDYSKRDGLSSYCKECRKSSSIILHRSNPDKQRASEIAYRRANPEKGSIRKAKYRAAKLNRTPSWLTKNDLAEIDRIYKIAANRTKETTTPHEVDHIVPLQGENVSGLHVPWNLQILQKSLNASKGNRLILKEAE